VSKLYDALYTLTSGKFIMIHDEKSREDEVDLVIAAQYVRPGDISQLRNMAGGMICLAISNDIARKLGLTYMHDMLHKISTDDSTLSKIILGQAPYGDRPSFSISINHIDTYTGVTDTDRALTINEMSKICAQIDSGGKDQFIRYFRTPGHVPLLIGARGLLEERLGHTELAVHLMKLANLTPSAVICEMLDSTTFRAVTLDRAKEISSTNKIPVLEAYEIKQVNGLKR
jgi:3,4-dihydroxy 2-butanone 4-phosphate synthase